MTTQYGEAEYSRNKNNSMSLFRLGSQRNPQHQFQRATGPEPRIFCQVLFFSGRVTFLYTLHYSVSRSAMLYQVLMGCPFGPAIDTWSVGVVMLELVLGRPLFHTAGSRAALLRQFTCAFGPVPLRRFRVGRYYSECFAQGQSQVKSSAER